MRPYSSEQQGIALLISIIIIGVLLLIIFSLTLMAWRELEISVVDSDSQQAFYAADSAVDCLLYYHFQEGDKRFKKPGDEEGFYSGSGPGPADRLWCGNEVMVAGTDLDGDKATTEFRLIDMREDEGDVGPCAESQVEIKREETDQFGWFEETVILQAEGYSTCREDDDDELEIGGVQRGVEAVISNPHSPDSDMLAVISGINDGLISWFPFDNDKVGGDTVSDKVNDHNPDLEHAAVTSDGCPTDRCIDFVDDDWGLDPGQEHYYSFKTEGAGAGAQEDLSFSISFWAKGSSNEEPGGLITSGHTGDFHGWDRGVGDNEGDFQFGFRDDSTDPKERVVVIVSDPPDDEWWHYLGVVDDDNDEVIVYVNGEEAGSGDIKKHFSDLSSDNFLVNSSYRHSGSAASSTPYKGKMDQIRIYDRALNEHEASFLYFRDRPDND